MYAITRAQLLRHPKGVALLIAWVSAIPDERSSQRRIKPRDKESSDEHENQPAKINPSWV